MDRAADATAKALGAWASVRGFFTPATLFLVVNLVIGTIWLTSRSHHRRRRGTGYATAAHQEQPPFQFHHQQEHGYYDDDHHHQQQQQQQQYVVPPPPAPAPLARTSSVLDRLRSIGLYRFRSGDFPPEYAAGAGAAPATDSPAPAPSSSEAWKAAEVAPAPAARVVRAAALEEDDVLHYTSADDLTGGNSFAQQHQQSPPAHQEVDDEEEQYYQEEYVPPLRPTPLARAPSVLERLRSFSLSRFVAADDTAAELELETNQNQTAQKKQATHYGRSSSEQSSKGKNQLQGTEPKILAKSSSEARKPVEAEEGGVDARADDFINSFRKQLQLQRLNSLLNYKDMLNRGA